MIPNQIVTELSQISSIVEKEDWKDLALEARNYLLLITDSCPQCGNPTIPINWTGTKGSEKLIIVCNNYSCSKYRQPLKRKVIMSDVKDLLIRIHKRLDEEFLS